MAIDVVNNLSSAVVTSGGTTASLSDTSLVVASAASFINTASASFTPPTQFRGVDPEAPSEIIIVTNQSGAGLVDWTVLRGQEGTSPVAHSADWIFQGTITAAALDNRYSYLLGQAWMAAITGVPVSSFNTATDPLPMGGYAIEDAYTENCFGDGSDGAIVCDGTTVNPGMNLVSGEYVMTRDIYASSILVDSGSLLDTNGYRVFCTGTLTNNGPINNLPLGSFGANSTLLAGGGAGGGGSTANGAAGTATALSMAAGDAGAGGHGSGTHTGGAAPTNVAPANPPHTVDGLMLPTSWTLSGGLYVKTAIAGGDGGSGGGGDGTNNGGNGGGGGGVMVICARVITGSGTFSVAGGPGGSPSAGTAGGGGGGNGGLMVIVSQSCSGAAISGFSGTCTAAGGTGGTAHGASPATNGGNGSNGTIIYLQVV